MIRRAREDDLPRLLELGKEFFAMTPYAEIFPYSADSTRATLLAIMANDQACLFVYERDGIDGAIMGAVVPMYTNMSVPAAIELAWFVAPTKRGGVAAMRLMRAFEHWGAEMGCALVVMSSLASNPAVARIYEREGYRPSECSYMKGL